MNRMKLRATVDLLEEVGPDRWMHKTDRDEIVVEVPVAPGTTVHAVQEVAGWFLGRRLEHVPQPHLDARDIADPSIGAALLATAAILLALIVVGTIVLHRYVPW